MKQIGILIFCLFGLTACDYLLDMRPENSLTFKNAFETENDLEAAVRNISRILRELHVVDAYRNEEVGFFADTIAERYFNGRQNLDPLFVRLGAWNCWYKLIASADVVLEFAGLIDAPEERKDYYRGQAYFYKAFAYFFIVRKYGDCVIIGEEADLEPKAKSPWTEVTGYAIEMARKAVALLPEYDKVKDARGNTARYKNVPCKGAANALLAHLCAWKAGGKYYAQPDQRNYDEMALWREAEQACTAVIGSETGSAGGVYRLASTPEEVCTSVLRGNSSEGIFEVEYRAYWEEVDKNTGGFGKSLTDEQATAYHGWLILTKVFGRGLNCIQNQACQIRATTAKAMFSGEDLRREAYFWKLDSMSHDTLLYITGGMAYPYAYREIRVATSGDNIGEYRNYDYNTIYWRLADIYLLRAECRARLGKEAEAVADLNEIRKRANAKLYDPSEYDGDLRYAIFKEREKELLYEGQRYFDIIRNGYARRELRGGFKSASDQDFIDGCYFYALDTPCFERNPLMRQNTWWHKYL